MPDAVAFAQSTKEMSEIVKLCSRHRVPIIPLAAAPTWKATSWR
jgi:D-lactate dehydrogenase (cytochrome)